MGIGGGDGGMLVALPQDALLRSSASVLYTGKGDHIRAGAQCV